MVVTHRGLSGPAILQISSLWREGEAVCIDLLPQAAEGFLQAQQTGASESGTARCAGRCAASAPGGRVPAGQRCRAPDRRGAGSRSRRSRRQPCAPGRFAPTGTEGYAKAEVTLGGVATAALSQRTMEANAVPGLFVIGEAVDVTGWLGGYNFQWAWASGFVAGEVA